MFRASSGSADVVPQVVPEPAVPADPIPISHLELDLPSPAEGWAVWLASQGVGILFDDLGRRAISREDARALFDAQRLSEIRRQDAAHRQEAEAILRDQQWRAQLNKGIPWYHLPDGVSYGQAAAAAEAASQPRRTPTQNEWLFNEVDDSMVYHEFPAEDGDE